MVINYLRCLNLFDRQGIYKTKLKLSICVWFYNPCGPWPLFQFLNQYIKNSVVLVRKRTIPTERAQPDGEVSTNFS
jgi:hypothetical protein